MAFFSELSYQLLTILRKIETVHHQDGSTRNVFQKDSCQFMWKSLNYKQKYKIKIKEGEFVSYANFISNVIASCVGSNHLLDPTWHQTSRNLQTHPPKVFNDKITNQITFVLFFKMQFVSTLQLRALRALTHLWCAVFCFCFHSTRSLCSLIQSSAGPRRAGTAVDGNSYTFESCRRAFRCSCRGRRRETSAARPSAFSSQLLDSHRRRRRRRATRSSSHSCGRSECDVARGRAIGRSLTSAGCSRGSIDTRMDSALEDVSVRSSIFCDTFCSWRGRSGTKPGWQGS